MNVQNCEYIRMWSEWFAKISKCVWTRNKITIVMTIIKLTLKLTIKLMIIKSTSATIRKNVQSIVKNILHYLEVNQFIYFDLNTKQLNWISWITFTANVYKNFMVFDISGWNW